MRKALTILSIAIAGPTAAWEFTETDICTVTHTDPQAQVTLTFNPAASIYDIALQLDGQTWGDGAQFRILFEGAKTISIGTTRQILSDDRTTLNVSDRGFGNVLDGLQFNDVMTATLGEQAVAISLDGAAEPLAAFRLCPTIATS